MSKRIRRSRLNIVAFAVLLGAAITGGGCACLPAERDVEIMLKARDMAVCTGQQLKSLRPSIEALPEPKDRLSLAADATEIETMYASMRQRAIERRGELVNALRSDEPSNAKADWSRLTDSIAASTKVLRDRVEALNTQIRRATNAAHTDVATIVIAAVGATREVSRLIDELETRDWRARRAERHELAHRLESEFTFPDYAALPGIPGGSCVPLDP